MTNEPFIPQDASPIDAEGSALPAQQPDQGSRSRRPVLVTCLAVVIAGVIFLSGFGIGFATGHLTGSPTAIGQGGDGAAQDALAPKFGVFWEALNILYRDYYGDIPAADKATYGAIRGVLGELTDPNTSFMTPQEADFFRTQIEGAFEGIGARVDWNQQADTVVVTEPFENQPAWKAGIKRDDFIIAVDGESIVGTDLESAIGKIRGPKGSTVVLTIVRDGEEAPFDIEVVRDRIELPTISTDTVGGNIAYIQLSSFNENAGDLVRHAVEEAMKTNPSGIIFDLRGNPGGLLAQAVEVGNVFLEDADILIERFSDGKEEVYKTDKPAVAATVPLVLLVNEGSASASEIVAGAVQDSGRGQLVGTKTYGKGSVQLPQTLSDGSIMRVTIARWFTPKDRTIDGTGLEPDVSIEITDEQRAAGDDPQLNKAIELLGGETTPLPVD